MSFKNYLMEVHVVNCWPNGMQHDQATTSGSQTMRIVVDQKSRGHQAFGCN